MAFTPEQAEQLIVSALEARIDAQLAFGKNEFKISNKQMSCFKEHLREKYMEAGWSVRCYSEGRYDYVQFNVLHTDSDTSAALSSIGMSQAEIGAFCREAGELQAYLLEKKLMDPGDSVPGQALLSLQSAYEIPDLQELQTWLSARGLAKPGDSTTSVALRALKALDPEVNLHRLIGATVQIFCRNWLMTYGHGESAKAVSVPHPTVDEVVKWLADVSDIGARNPVGHQST